MKEYYCGECGEKCNAGIVDFGIGFTEYWGHVANHSDKRFVSQCCEATVFSDEELTCEETAPEPYEPW